MEIIAYVRYCIFVVGNYKDPIDIFKLRHTIYVVDGCEVIYLCSILLVCSSFNCAGVNLVASKIWHTKAKFSCILMCISSYFYVAFWNASSVNSITWSPIFSKSSLVNAWITCSFVSFLFLCVWYGTSLSCSFLFSHVLSFVYLGVPPTPFLCSCFSPCLCLLNLHLYLFQY